MGLWLSLATMTGTMDLTDRGNYIYMEWRQLISGSASLLRFDFGFFWPVNMFGLPLGELLMSFIELITDLIGDWKETVFKMMILPFLESLEGWDHLDMGILKLLQDGSRAIMSFNALLNVIKPLSVAVLMIWTKVARGVYKDT